MHFGLPGELIEYGQGFNIAGVPDAQLREALTGMDYQTSFMLYLYIRDLRELYRRGWELPTGITEADLDYLEELAQSNGQSQ
mgnify:CR=1 FL=1